MENDPNPTYVLVEDVDGGISVARYSYTVETEDKELVPLYKELVYYHNLEDAIRGW